MSNDGWGDSSSNNPVKNAGGFGASAGDDRGSFAGKSFSGGGFSSGGGGSFGSSGQTPFGAHQASSFGASRPSSGDKPTGFGDEKPVGFGSKPTGFGAEKASGNGDGGFGGSKGFGGNSTGFGETQASSFGSKPSGFSDNTSSGYPNKPPGFPDKPTGFSQSTGFGNTQSSNFGSSKPVGFGESSSFGSSKPSGFADSQSSFGNKNSTGFGNTNATGFGNTNATGFGNTNTGFGNTNTGFGSGDNQSYGGGGGGGFGGGRNFGDDSGSKNCFNCNEPGHQSRDCDKPRAPREGGRGNCYNCDQPGHNSRDCDKPRVPREGGRGNCFNCNQPGHNSRDCPEERRPREQRSGGGGFGGNGFGSGGDNGFSSGSQGFGGRGGEGNFGSSAGGFGGAEGGESRGPMKCFKCEKEGHRASDCDEEPKCFNCRQTGHTSRDCPTPREPKEGEGPRATYIPEEEGVETIFDLQKIKEGLMFSKFFDADVTISSGGKSQTIHPVKEFKDSGLTDRLLKNVAQAGYQKTTPIQQYSIPLIRMGKDIMACAQTGSGKTAAFLLPIMSALLNDSDLNTAGEGGCFPRCIILTPTRELADQIYNEGRKFAYQTMMEIKPVYGGLAVGYNRAQLERGSSIIVGTVGRIKHFILEGIINLSKVRFIVLDEADRMIDAMGFGEEIETIINHEKMPTKDERQTLMFSATFPDTVQYAARNFLKDDYGMITIDKIGAANKCVVQEFVQCSRGEKGDKLLELLGVDLETYTTCKDADVYTKKTMVFVAQRALADTLAASLSLSGVPAITIHGAREQRERSEALRQFRNGSKPVLIATAVAERGLDIKGVDHVINYDLPEHIDDYVHRIGRTGRVGNSGRSTSFVSEENMGLVPELLKILADAEQIVPEWMAGSCIGASSFGGNVAAQAEEDETW